MPSDRPLLTIGTILGELITASGIVSANVVEEALVHARECGMPLGRVLVMSGHLGEGDLNSALHAAKMVKESKLTRRQATQALREAYHQCIPFEQALDDILDFYPATKLGILLIRADIVSDTTLSKLEERTREAGILGNTLGQALTTHGIISSSLLAQAIELLTLTREGRINLDQAAEALRACCAAKLPAEIALQKVTGETIRATQLARIGALLTTSEIATRDEVLLAAEIGAEANRPIGEILIELGIIDEYVLQATLTVQGMIAVGSLTETQGLEILHQVRCQRVPVEQVLDELRVLKKRIVELLKFATIIDERHIQHAIELYPSFAHDVARALISANIVDLPTIKNAVRCLALMQSDGVKEDIAAAALRHSQRTGMSIETAIAAASALDKPVTVSQAGMKIVETVQEHFQPAPVPMPSHFDATPPGLPQVPMSA